MKNDFFFPNFELAKFEIENSSLANKISNEELQYYLHKSWDKGKKEAVNIIKEFGNNINFFEIFNKNNIKINKYNIDKIIGNIRYYAEYITKTREINLYLKSIELWANNNEINFNRACNMTLAHEYFHYLELTKIGILSDKNNIPLFKLFNKPIGKSRYLVLSEIGAYAFVNKLYQEGAI